MVGRARTEILSRLCEGPQTVADLTSALGMTRNSVRERLTAMERDGLVHRSGSRSTGGKPAHVYRITAVGQGLLSALYRPVLEQVVTVAGERLGRDQLSDMLQEAGRRLLDAGTVAEGELGERARAAADLLNGLGGAVEVLPEGDAFLLRSRCCPLGAVVPSSPEICSVVEGLLEAFLAVPVEERCVKTDSPGCRFRVGGAAPGGGGGAEAISEGRTR